VAKVAVTASQLHYGLATLATLKCVWHFEPAFGAWVIAFWVAAIGGDKLNTADPNK
jgi:hypothetical protein